MTAQQRTFHYLTMSRTPPPPTHRQSYEIIIGSWEILFLSQSPSRYYYYFYLAMPSTRVGVWVFILKLGHRICKLILQQFSGHQSNSDGLPSTPTPSFWYYYLYLLLSLALTRLLLLDFIQCQYYCPNELLFTKGSQANLML